MVLLFGLGKKKPTLIGANDKLELAKRIREASKANMQFKQGKTLTANQTVPIVVIFAVSVALAFFLTDKGGSMFFGGLSTGFYKLDLLLMGPGIPSLIGDVEMNRVLVIFIRGFAYFLLTGLAPFIAFLFINVTGKNSVNAMVACWLIICIMLFLYTSKDFLLSVVKDIVKGF